MFDFILCPFLRPWKQKERKFLVVAFTNSNPNSCSESGLLQFCRGEIHFWHPKICWWIHGTIFASSALGDNPGRLRSYRAEVDPDIWVSFDLRPSRVAFICVNKSKTETKHRQSIQPMLWHSNCRGLIFSSFLHTAIAKKANTDFFSKCPLQTSLKLYWLLEVSRTVQTIDRSRLCFLLFLWIFFRHCDH